MRIKFAAITCEFTFEDDWLADEAEQRYRPFLVSDHADYMFTVSISGKDYQTITLEDGSIIYQDMNISTSKVGNVCNLKREDFPFEAQVDLSTKVGSVSVAHYLRCFDSFLRAIYSLLLAYNDGILLHAAAVKGEDMGLIFTGKSGSGKSTMAGLADDLVLSDELIAIRRINGEYIVFSTPFWGGYTPGEVNDSARITTIYTLAQDIQDFEKELNSVKAIQGIVENVIFYGPDERTVPVFDYCVDLVRAIPVKELHFRRSREIYGVIKKGSVRNVG